MWMCGHTLPGTRHKVGPGALTSSLSVVVMVKMVSGRRLSFEDHSTSCSHMLQAKAVCERSLTGVRVARIPQPPGC